MFSGKGGEGSAFGVTTAARELLARTGVLESSCGCVARSSDAEKSRTWGSVRNAQRANGVGGRGAVVKAHVSEDIEYRA